MTNEKIVAEKLLYINALKLNIEEPFTWASGWKSPIYCDNRRILSFPFIRDFIKSELSNMIYEKFPDAEVIAGVATAGIPHGMMVADQLKLPFIYVRSKPKAHGLGNQIEGSFEEGQKVVVVEDLISTGKSSIEVCEVLIANGMQVLGVVSIFNYGFEKAENAFKEANINCKSLTSYSSLIQLALDKGIVAPEDEEELLKWREAPQNWRNN